MCPPDDNPDRVKQVGDWIQANPGKTAMYAVAGVALAAPAVIAGPLLAAAGFGANGIAAASLASAAQSGIGNVVAGSVFATLQSAGMAGYGAAVVNGVVQAGAIGLAAGATMLRGPSTPSPLEKSWSYLKTESKESPYLYAFAQVNESVEGISEGFQGLWDHVSTSMITDLYTSGTDWVENIKDKGFKPKL